MIQHASSLCAGRLFDGSLQSAAPGRRAKLGKEDLKPTKNTTIRIVSNCGKPRLRIEVAVAAMGALAHEHRLAAYRLLVEAGPSGLPAGAIAERLSLAPSSLTFHLQQLLHAGLATRRRASRQIIYAADYTAMNDLLGYLTENCCGRGDAAPGCSPACLPGVPAANFSPRAKRKSA